MLQRLSVKNFALIEDINITFDEGLTVLTGETGTGKTIILESLHLLFGKRSDQEMIRHGEQKAEVFGVFKINKEIQLKYDLPEVIEVSREVDKSGRHKMLLNNNIITLAYLKTVMDDIGSMHSQNDTMQLLDASTYLTFIDQVDYKKISKLQTTYLISRSNYIDMKRHLEKLKNKKALDIEQQEFFEYQLKELKSHNLVLDEKATILKEIERLTHFDKISSNLKESYYIFDNEDFNQASLFDAAKKLEAIATFDLTFNKHSEMLLDMYYNLTEIKEYLFNEIESLDYDPVEFDSMQERIFELTKLEDKYNKDISDLIILTEELEEKISLINNYDEYIEEYTLKVEKAFTKAFDDATYLSDCRKLLAKKLEIELVRELKDLDLNKAVINIVFEEVLITPSSLLESGIDRIDFHISLNEGEPIKPLSRVASGGERARFMFALKAIYAKQNKLSLLVLDEIDIGISGKTAAKVAIKMQTLSKDHQLIVITHLPQVAARADNHYGINKMLVNNRMVTKIEKLTHDQRVEMIALMLSDEQLSHFAIEQAKMLLDK